MNSLDSFEIIKIVYETFYDFVENKIEVVF